MLSELDLRRCKRVVRVIDELLADRCGFKVTHVDLKGTIVLLRESQSHLSLQFQRNWKVLEELNA